MRHLFALILLSIISSANAADLQVAQEKNFWQLIETVKREAGSDVDSRPAILQRHLDLFTPRQIQRFQKTYEGHLLEAHRWSLWGAAYLMNDGCSDDCFKYFRDWLISEGETTFKHAIADPDSLASMPPRDYFELESYGYAALKAFAAMGAGELERDFAVEFAAPTGKEWADSELPKMLPKLVAKYRKD